MAESRLAVLAAFAGNLLIAVLKLLAGLAASSAAMLAEAAHSFSDVGNQVLLMLGIARSDRPPSRKHPFGTAQAAYFWPFMVAILLFGVAGAYSLLEGIEKVRHPHEVGDIRLALGVLAVSFAIEATSLFVADRQARGSARRRGIRSFRGFLDDNRDATILTVIVEDTLAIIGLPVAALALGMTVWTGDPVWDGVGSLIIGTLLMAFALFLGSEVQQLLLGRGLSRRDLGTVMRLMRGAPVVHRIHSVQAMYLGPETVLLGAEFEVPNGMESRKLTTALDRLESELRQAVPQLRYVYLEPHEAHGRRGR